MDMVELLLPYGFDTLEYSWVKAIISICIRAYYSVTKERQQREATCKRDNTNNSENAIKVYQELTYRACATRMYNWLPFEGSLPM
jgi:hypothetical protein